MKTNCKLFILLILYILIIHPIIGQEERPPYRLKYIDYIDVLKPRMVDVDSTLISFTSYYDLETSSMEQETSICIFKKAILSKKEQQQLNDFLFSEESFNSNFSLLSYSDIDIIFIKNDTINCKITISTITRNFVFNKNNDLYIGKISKRFESFLTKLLIRKKIWNKTDKSMRFVPTD